jgi:hypothetical protein
MESAMPKRCYSRPTVQLVIQQFPVKQMQTTRVTYDVCSSDDMLNNHPSQNITYLGNETTLSEVANSMIMRQW